MNIKTKLAKHISTGNLFGHIISNVWVDSHSSNNQVKIPNYLIENNKDFKVFEVDNLLSLSNGKINTVYSSKGVFFDKQTVVSWNNELGKISEFVLGEDSKIYANIKFEHHTNQCFINELSFPEKVFTDSLGNKAKTGSKVWSVLPTDNVPLPFNLKYNTYPDNNWGFSPRRIYFVNYDDAVSHLDSIKLRFSKQDILNFFEDNFQNFQIEISNIKLANKYEYCKKKVDEWITCQEQVLLEINNMKNEE